MLQRLCAGPKVRGPVPTLAVIVAHPDDEVIGAGAQFPRWPGAVFVHVTDGSPRDLGDARAAGFASREDYSRARFAELRAALALAGIGPEQMHALGVVDQEASLDLPGLARTLADRLRQTRAEAVLTHAYEGGHPDHDATAFAVHAACRLLQQQGARPPAILEMPLYRNGPTGMVVSEFLPHPDTEAVTLTLSPEECTFKQKLIACYVSQERVLRAFPVGVERFRTAPAYDFTRPPHEGRLWYEHRNWGMTGDRWLVLAREALAALGMRGPG
jgi:LmbE family N-acetylglucosaminyl deacetylase